MRIETAFMAIALILLSYTVHGQHYVRGVVVDENRMSLPGATICTFPDTICTSADENGAFELRRRTPAGRIEVSYVGFEKKLLELDVLDPPDHLHIRLRSASQNLDEVRIVEGYLGSDAYQPVRIVGDELFEGEAAGNFSAALSRLPGLSNISIGVGVGKPVIRGLYSNRVIVTDRGVKQESHQWGTDHGLEIDQFRPAAVEVVKGPSSLEYGSDGLGGVIKVRPDPVADKNSIQGSVQGIAKSNNKHIGMAVNLGVSGDKFFGSANFSKQSFADFRVPADNFVYNTFELPLFNKRLKNTAGRENALSLTTGYRDENHFFRISVSEYEVKTGIFSGAFGIPRSYALQDDGDDRNIDLPSQKARHRQLAATYHRLLNNQQRVEITAGFQTNKRREFSFPEFHAIPESGSNDRLALQLDLMTLSLDAIYRDGDNWSAGINAQYQNNKIDGFDYFLPPFEVFRFGAFKTRKLEVSDRTEIKLGLRLDFGNNQSERAGRNVWDNSGGVIDSLISRAENQHFFNFAGSAGWIHQLPATDGLEISAQLGKSFRIPYPVETSSNGVHHGTFRHEKGLPGLNSEHGYQLDVGIRYLRPGFYLSFTPYFNFFKDYIYLRPAAEFSPLPDAGQLYRYEQHDALYTGFELEWEILFAGKLSLYQGLETIWNHNLDTGLPLPFTPPSSILSEIKWNDAIEADWIKISAWVSHRYAFAQNRVDRNELQTPSYNLFNAGITASFPGVMDGVRLRFQAMNLTDQSHFDHLSRYRQLNIPEQGRNFSLQLRVPFKYFL